ncbi:putative bromodomain-containing protein [Cyclospora cayetanensis]|uniref:Bromodomain-containing protein n=1 Tax=Cyclospora cayetanensis TaxID=88456 RepID=A0A1D3D499_9EIME|nr:putative bromodomain-containing protein [Cyclospora cayetanensis]
MRRRAKQEVLKIDKQRRIELVKQGKSAYELRALAAAEELSREFRMRTPLQEFLLTAAEYGGGRQRELLQRLNVSFDADFVKRQIHQREHGQAARGGAPLLHVKAALQLYGVSPVAGRRARVAMLRFHRPDIRSSFANPTSRKRGGVSAAEKPWIVLPPVGSEVLRRNSDASFVGAGDTVDFESTVAGSMPSQGVMGDSHPSLCFYSPKDLTLSDDCPFVVLEHTEQQPFIVNNPGMSLRVTRYVRPLSAPLQGSAASAQPQIKAERIRAEEERLQVRARLSWSALCFLLSSFLIRRIHSFLLGQKGALMILGEATSSLSADGTKTGGGYVRETGVMELKRVKELMKSRFCPPVIEKEVAQLLKQLSPIAPHRLPVLPESSITSIISPEAVCALESSHAAWYRLRAFSNSRAGRRYSPLIRFIEELLLSVPWQTTKECREVLQNKGSAQFLLTGFGDPSCGRGEGITLLKRGSRIRNSNNPLAVQQATRRQAAGGIAGTVDDLRKLGMMELRARLLQYGLSDAVIRTLPRWDQVALVRQYRDGFGAEESSGKGNRGAGTRLPAEEYEAKLASILKRQQAALRADLPVVTDTEDEMQTPPLQLQQLTDGASTAAAGPNPHQQLGAGEDVADALFAGCEDSDHEVTFAFAYVKLQVFRSRLDVGVICFPRLSRCQTI